MKSILLSVLIVFFLCTPVFAETYAVKRVIDGDTLELENGEKVHLIGIDAPEANTPMGKEAMEFLEEFINNSVRSVGEVILEFDIQEKDKHGRLLAYVYIIKRYSCFKCDVPSNEPDREFKVFLNGQIVKEGYATPMPIPPNVKHAELFEKLYQEARERNSGDTPLYPN